MYSSCVLILLTISCEHVYGARLKVPVKSQFHGSGRHIDAKMGVETSPCTSLEQRSLSGILGAAFNPRYMSVKSPEDSEDVEEGLLSNKRDTDTYRPFSVDQDFSSDVNSDTPAWEVDHFKSDYFTHGRTKRSSVDNTTAMDRTHRDKRTVSTPWECKSVIKWIDLGIDYFPRYLRNVECTKHKCWYDTFECRPKSFTVKILRRKNGQCVADNGRRITEQGIPYELKELWVWEERAVNFCCECAPS